MKADYVGLGIADVLARKCLGLDLVESVLVIEQLHHRPAAVRPLDRKLTAVNLVDARGDIEPNRGALRQHFYRMVDNGTFLKIGNFQVSHNHSEDDAGLTSRIDS